MKSNKHAKMLLQSAGFWDRECSPVRASLAHRLARYYPNNHVIVTVDRSGFGQVIHKRLFYVVK